MTEDLETQAVRVKLLAEESKLPQVSCQEGTSKTGFGAEAAVEQPIIPARWETYSDDSSEDEDFTPAAKREYTQENKLQYAIIDEVSWAKIES